MVGIFTGQTSLLIQCRILVIRSVALAGICVYTYIYTYRPSLHSSNKQNDIPYTEKKSVYP